MMWKTHFEMTWWDGSFAKEAPEAGGAAGQLEGFGQEGSAVAGVALLHDWQAVLVRLLQHQVRLVVVLVRVRLGVEADQVVRLLWQLSGAAVRLGRVESAQEVGEVRLRQDAVDQRLFGVDAGRHGEAAGGAGQQQTRTQDADHGRHQRADAACRESHHICER